MKTQTRWRDKLEKEQDAKVVDVPVKWRERFGEGTMLIARPLDVDALIRRVERGKLVTQEQVREKLARDAGVDVTCPLTTGIFLRIVAEAAEEDLREGREPVAPYWRVVKPDGSLNERYPGGVERQAALLKGEGHATEPAKGRKPPKVASFERYLQEL